MVEELKNLFFTKRKFVIAAVFGAFYIATFFIFKYFSIDRSSLQSVIDIFGDHDSTMIYVLQLFFSLTPLPDTLIIYFSVVLVGVYETFFLIYLGMLSASLIHFGLARFMGPSLVYRIFPKMKGQIEDFHGQMDTHHLIIYRFISLISFDIVAYVAGFSNIEFRKFFVSTALGLPPVIIPNILLAHGLLSNNIWNTLVLWIGAGIIMLLLAYLVKKFY